MARGTFPRFQPRLRKAEQIDVETFRLQIAGSTKRPPIRLGGVARRAVAIQPHGLDAVLGADLHEHRSAIGDGTAPPDERTLFVLGEQAFRRRRALPPPLLVVKIKPAIEDLVLRRDPAAIRPKRAIPFAAAGVLFLAIRVRFADDPALRIEEPALERAPQLEAPRAEPARHPRRAFLRVVGAP